MKRNRIILGSFKQNIKDFFDYFIGTIFLFFKVFFIGAVAGLAGAQSEPIIYHLNPSMRLGYAHYVSYIGAGLIGTVLWFFIFPNKEK